MPDPTVQLTGTKVWATFKLWRMSGRTLLRTLCYRRLYFPPGATSESDVGFLIHHRTLAAMKVVGTRYVPARGAAIPQTCANQAAVACALERYRLANGQFPETLDALAPRFIVRVPNDVIGGQTYKYRRTDDRQFILYSVGWDEKDDGGVPGKALFDLEHGDWVWAYPAK